MDTKKLRRAFNLQAYNCCKRVDALGNRIEMRLTFEQWLQIWVDSGKLEKRGRKSGCYVMSRIDDIGHYEIGNVVIQTFRDNVKDTGKRLGRSRPRPWVTKALKGRPRDPEASRKCSESLKGVKKSEAHNRANSEAQRLIKKTCQHCGKTGGMLGMNRWHGDNCKFKVDDQRST